MLYFFWRAEPLTCTKKLMADLNYIRYITIKPLFYNTGFLLLLKATFQHYETYNNKNAIISANNPVASENANPNIA